MKREEYKKMKDDSYKRVDDTIMHDELLNGWDDEESYMDLFKRMVKTPWGKAVVILLVLIGGLLIFLALSIPKTKKDKGETTFANYLEDTEYMLHLKDEKERLIAFVVSEEVEETDAVSLASYMRDEVEKDVLVYVYEEEPEEYIQPDFYNEGLLFSIESFKDNRYESRTFLPVPTVEGDVNALAGWQLDSKDSYVDTNNTLRVHGSVPTISTTEQTVSLLKGLGGSIKEINEVTFEDVIFRVKSGLNEFDYAINHPHVLADITMYQMEEFSKGAK